MEWRRGGAAAPSGARLGGEAGGGSWAGFCQAGDAFEDPSSAKAQEHTVKHSLDGGEERSARLRQFEFVVRKI